MLNSKQILNLLDYTFLEHNANELELEEFCYKTNISLPSTICIFPEHIEFIKQRINSNILIAVVVGNFPIGSNDINEIITSINFAINSGANEVDCVLEPRFTEDFPGIIEEEKLNAMRQASSGIVLKVILETSLLEESIIRKVCQMALRCGVDFLKTSTGKRGGCTLQSASILADEANKYFQSTGIRRGVKLSGGIRTISGANELISAVLSIYPKEKEQQNKEENQDNEENQELTNSKKTYITIEELSHNDSTWLRIGASGILEELVPSLFQKTSSTTSNLNLNCGNDNNISNNTSY